MNVLQLALNALEYPYKEGNSVADAIEALRKALEQEPVAWLIYLNDDGSERTIRWTSPDSQWSFKKIFPLYTHPQPKEWVGLTKEDLQEFVKEISSWEELCYAAEAKLKEKNT